VSWNIKQIVNLQRIHGYNSVNLRQGYPLIGIRTPREVMSRLGGVGGKGTRRGEEAAHVGPRGAGPLEVPAATGAHEPVGADLGEAAGEDVLEEAGEEGLHRDGEAPGLMSAGVGVAEGDMAVGEALQALVGEGDAVDVAREIGLDPAMRSSTWPGQVHAAADERRAREGGCGSMGGAARG